LVYDILSWINILQQQNNQLMESVRLLTYSSKYKTGSQQSAFNYCNDIRVVLKEFLFYYFVIFIWSQVHLFFH